MSVSLPLSPIPVNDEQDRPNSEYDYVPDSNLNHSVNSSNSSGSSDEEADPSSDVQQQLAPTTRVNLQYYDDREDSDSSEIDVAKINTDHDAIHYYNNPRDEAGYLKEIFFDFLILSMVGNLVHWVERTSEDLLISPWFRNFGYRRLFLEAFSITMSRLPFPRVSNIFGSRDWLTALHKRSSDCKLLEFSWLTFLPLRPTSARIYKPITTHWYMSASNGCSGFVLGIKDVEPRSSDGGYFWKRHFFTTLPNTCWQQLPHFLPNLNFGGDLIAAVDVEVVTDSTVQGYWSVDYDNLILQSLVVPPSLQVALPEELDPSAFDPVSIPGLTRWLPQTCLPSIPIDQTPLPLCHVEPGSISLTPPYHQTLLQPSNLLQYPFPSCQQLHSWEQDLAKVELKLVQHDRTLEESKLGCERCIERVTDLETFFHATGVQAAVENIGNKFNLLKADLDNLSTRFASLEESVKQGFKRKR